MIPQIKLNSVFPDDYEFIPLNMRPTRFFTFTIEGFDEIKIISKDINFQNALSFIDCNLSKLLETYQEKYVFSEPQLIFIPATWRENFKVGLKIGMMEKKDFEKRKKGIFEDKK